MTKVSASWDWRRLLQVISVITLACAILGGLADDADAKRKKKRVSAYSPPYAEMVVDMNSGRVLRAVNADEPRFPASITKVMTLYLLFEQIERGRMTLNTPLEVSAFAAAQAPSKLGLRPGSTIAVEDAILALVTKSANDVAVTVAENIGGSQDRFAQMMTRKARQLGMRNTTFRNASGLPNPQQRTTARDLVRLGIAMKRDFPQYYDYFKTRSFTYRGVAHRNHNRLLGRVAGVDGIKTGFTRASGFNLLTSARQGKRQIMTVVLGGRSGGARDARVAALVNQHLGRASNRANPELAQPQLAALDAGDDGEDGAEASSTRLKPKGNKARPAVVAADETTPAESQSALAFSADKPVLTGPAVRKRKNRKAVEPEKAQIAAAKKAEPEMRWVVSEESPAPAKTKRDRKKPVQVAAAEADVAVTNTTEAAPKARKGTGKGDAKPARPASGWVIQLTAAESEEQAMKVLGKAKAKQGRVLANAVAFTEQVQKGDATLWRARFGGFDGDDAQAACSALKKSGFKCLAQRVG